MRERKITLLGPEGTNLTLLVIFLVLNFISWLTLFTLSDGLSLDLNNSLFRQIVFTLLSVILFFAITYISMDQINLYTFPFFWTYNNFAYFYFYDRPKRGCS